VLKEGWRLFSHWLHPLTLAKKDNFVYYCIKVERDMKIKKSGKIYKWLQYLDTMSDYDTPLVKTTRGCPLFWKTLLAFIFLPIMWLATKAGTGAAYIADYLDNKVNLKFAIKWFAISLVGIGFTLLIVLLGVMASVIGLIKFIAIIIFILVLTSGVIGIIFGINWLFEYSNKEYDKEDSKLYFFIQGIKAVYNRACPLVVFTDE